MIETLFRKMTVVTGVCLVSSTLVIGQPALAHDTATIDNAIVDDGLGLITLTGNDFPAVPFVTFDGAQATISGAPSSEEIVIEFDAEPGTYRVIVSDGHVPRAGACVLRNCISVAVGAIGAGGPAGPQGPIGPAGDDGAVGAVGPAGAGPARRTW